MSKFPSGVEFDNLEIYNDILLIDLPSEGKLAIEDIWYLGTFALNLGLSGVNISVGEFSAFIPVDAIQHYFENKDDLDKFISKWQDFIWLDKVIAE